MGGDPGSCHGGPLAVKWQTGGRGCALDDSRWRQQKLCTIFLTSFLMHPPTSYINDIRCSNYLQLDIFFFTWKLLLAATFSSESWLNQESEQRELIHSLQGNVTQGPHLYTSLIPFIHLLNKRSLMSTLCQVLCLMLELQGRIRHGPTFQDYTLLGDRCYKESAEWAELSAIWLAYPSSQMVLQTYWLVLL